MNLSAASLLLLATIPGALSANKVCHLFIYVAHIMCSFGGVESGEAHHIHIVGLSMSLLWCTTMTISSLQYVTMCMYIRDSILAVCTSSADRCATRWSSVSTVGAKYDDDIMICVVQ